MSCLRNSIRQIHPSLQELVEAIENASTLTLLILSTWRLARMLVLKLVVEVLTDIAAALKSDGLPETARKALKNLYEYLDARQYHIQYQKFRELGLPIGSGMVESACKWLIQQRFKGVGMRWSETCFNHLLHLRLVWVNGRFEELFALEDSPN